MVWPVSYRYRYLLHVTNKTVAWCESYRVHESTPELNNALRAHIDCVTESTKRKKRGTKQIKYGIQCQGLHMSPLRLMVILKPITITSTDDVQRGLSPIELEESQIKQRADNNGCNSEGPKQPSEPVLDVDRDQGEVEGGGESGLELRESRDERLHLLGSLGERVLQRGDGSEDLGDPDEDVRSGNDPNVDRSRVREPIRILTLGRQVIVTRRFLVDELLENGGV